MKLHELLADLSLNGLTDSEALEIATDLIKVDMIKERLRHELDAVMLSDAIAATKVNSEHEQAYTSVLSSLSIKQRQVFLMRDIKLMTYQAIATDLNVSIGTIQSHLERARSKIEAAKESITIKGA